MLVMPGSAPSVMVVSGEIGLSKMVCSSNVVFRSDRWNGTPGVRVEPSSLTQEYLTAAGSKKIAAEVTVAKISWEDRRVSRIMMFIDL